MTEMFQQYILFGFYILQHPQIRRNKNIAAIFK